MLDNLLGQARATLLHRFLLGRWASRQTLREFCGNQPAEFAWRLLLSTQGLEELCNMSLKLHLHLIHNARLKLVRSLLPSGNTILDLAPRIPRFTEWATHMISNGWR
jgi:hypothetical protein